MSSRTRVIAVLTAALLGTLPTRGWADDHFYRVRDILPGTSSNPSSTPSEPVVMEGVAYFRATDDHGAELWRSDGTASGTYRVKDINVGPASSNPDQLMASAGMLFFIADDGTSGPELWRSDGTPEGTRLVRDIVPGGTSAQIGSLAPLGNVVLFRAVTAAAGAELWRSDGTEGGTVLVKDIVPGPGFSNPNHLVAVGDRVFMAASSDSGVELWRSDGTETGTLLVSDLRLGPASSSPNLLTAAEDRLFFVANDGLLGAELWTSDGTSTGTHLVRDLALGPTSPLIGEIVALGGSAFFTATTLGFGNELWTSDGTFAGTRLVKDIAAGSSAPRHLAAALGQVWFEAQSSPTGRELWRSDGTEEGTQLVADVRPGSADGGADLITAGPDTVYFVARGEASGLELWHTDGTGSGTLLVADVLPGSSDSSPAALTALGALLLFSADDGEVGRELWRSDGTPAGTALVRDLDSGLRSSSPGELLAVGDRLLFAATDASGRELWVSDGTEEQTVLLKEIRSGSSSSNPSSLTLSSGRAYFSATHSSDGNELWRSDGTAAGTVLVRDIADGGASSSPSGLVDLGGTLLFAATTSATGRELWRSDGTSGGTVLVRDLAPGTPSSSPTSLTRAGAFVFFVAGDAARGRELWRTDGTAAGTLLLADLVPGPASSGPAGLHAAGGFLYFAADDAVHGAELWRSDGTPAGTVLLADLRPGPGGSSPQGFATREGRIYFVADDGLTGPELWATDGTAEGTVRVADLRPGAAGSKPRLLTASGDKLYLSADDGTHGRELWVSDGTSAGTALVADLNPGPADGDPEALFDANGTLLFRARDSVAGAEPWSSDGTAVGTRRLQDIHPGEESSEIEGFTAANGLLFFAAHDGASGLELWALRNAPPQAVAGADLAVEVGEEAELDGSSSSDPDLDPLSFEWRDASGTRLGAEASLRLALAEGTHVLTLTVRDGFGGAAMDEVVVVVADRRAPEVVLAAPRDATLVAGVPTVVRWTAKDAGGVSRIDLFYSADGGSTFAEVPGCASLPPEASSCDWVPPLPATAAGRLRVEARDAASNRGADESSLVVEAPTLRLLAPRGGETWAQGTLQTITWTSNLPTTETLEVQLSRDGGASFEVLAEAHPNSGAFSWLAAGPSTSTAFVQLAWARGAAVARSEGPVTINRTPRASAGPDVAGELGTPVLLDGSASTDPDGDPLQYAWTGAGGLLGSGPAVEVVLPFGRHPITLTVRDAFGGVSEDTVEVRVFHTTTLDLEVVGEAGGTGRVHVDPPGDACGNGPEPDRECRYTYTDEPTVVLTAAPAADTEFVGFTGACEGSAPCTLSLAENRSVAARFRLRNRAPIAVPGGPYEAARNVLVAFDGSLSSDPDGDPLAYEWDFGDGSTGTGPRPEHSYASLGEYRVVLVVSDGRATSEPVSTLVRVVNRAPVANAGPDVVAELGAVVVLVGSATDPDQDALSYVWTRNGVPVGAGPEVSLALPLGVHTLTLAVADGEGGQGEDEAVVTVRDTTPPALVLSSPAEGFRFLVGRAAAFSWTAGDLGGLDRLDLLVSADGGSFLPAEGCAGLPGTAVGCTWSSPGPVTAAGVLRLQARDASGNVAQVEAPFTAEEAALILVAPSSGAGWGLGSVQTIRFTHNLGPAATFRIQLARDDNGFEELASAVPSPDGQTGTFTWTVTGPVASQARVQVVWTDDDRVKASSAEPFAITLAAIILVTPNGGETWGVGSEETVTFTHNLGSQALFRVELSRSGGTSWTPIATAVSATNEGHGSFAWWVTGPGTTRARIRVVWAASAAVSDRSDANFVIR